MENIDIVSKETEKIMLERENISNNEDSVIDKNIANDNNNEQEIINVDQNIPKSKKNIDEKKEEIEKNDDDKIVDETDASYKIHKGRIDCTEIDKCMDISDLIKNDYNYLIQDIIYVPVLNKNKKSLGYFINYLFHDYKFDTYQECNSIGIKLKELLSDINYNCTDDYVIHITRDNMEEVND